MTTSDDSLLATFGNSPMAQPLGLIYQQLKIITLVLKQAYAISDDDFALLQVPTPNFAPGSSAIPPTPYLSQTTL